MDQMLQAPIAIYEQANDVVRKSQKGVIEAMQDAPPPEQRDAPWSRQDLEQIRDKNARIAKSNHDLAKAQQDLADAAAKALRQLPKDHPKYKEIQDRLKEISSQLPDTRNQAREYERKTQEANVAIENWRKREDPSYVPPVHPQKPTLNPGTRVATIPKTETPAEPSTEPPAEPPPEPPAEAPIEPPKPKQPTGPPANSVDSLKQQEAEQEAAVRALGKERQSAVNKYLDDPSAENHSDAQALRQKLDGLLDDLNNLREQVDTQQGNPLRPRLHARSATAIAKQHQRDKENGTNTDGTPTQPTGGGCGMGAAGASGTDQPHMYREVAPDQAGTSSGAKRTGMNNHGGGGTKRARTGNQAGNVGQMNHHTNTNESGRGQGMKMSSGHSGVNSNRSSSNHQHQHQHQHTASADGMRSHSQHQSMPQSNNRRKRQGKNF